MKKETLQEDRAALGFLFVLAALYFLPVLLKGNSQVLSVAGADTWSQFLYWRSFGYGALARGEIPLWNPYVFSGTPYIAGIQSAVFYPLNLPFLLFETPFAINMTIALHYLLASLFVYLFARHLGMGAGGATVAAMAFAYGAPYFLRIYAGHLSVIATVVWMPLVFIGLDLFLAKKSFRYAWLSGIPLSFQILAGHPQYAFYSALAFSSIASSTSRFRAAGGRCRTFWPVFACSFSPARRLPLSSSFPLSSWPDTPSGRLQPTNGFRGCPSHPRI